MGAIASLPTRTPRESEQTELEEINAQPHIFSSQFPVVQDVLESQSPVSPVTASSSSTRPTTVTSPLYFGPKFLIDTSSYTGTSSSISSLFWNEIWSVLLGSGTTSEAEWSLFGNIYSESLLGKAH